MRIRVLRDKATDKYTLSEIFAFYGNDVMFSGFGVENPWMDNQTHVSCIPAGTYKAFTRVGSNGNVIELEDVPGRTHIQFHVGNTAADVDGCIAVGMGRTKEGVSDSAIAMRKLYALAEGQDITVEVMDMVLPQRKGDEIQFGIIDPAEIPVWRTEMPAERLEPVSYSNTLAEFVGALETKFKRQRTARLIFNGVISLLSKRVPELKHLKLNVMTQKKGWLEKKLEEKSTYVGALVTVAVLVLGYFGYNVGVAELTTAVEALVIAVSALIVAGAGLYDLFRDEEDSSEG